MIRTNAKKCRMSRGLQGDEVRRRRQWVLEAVFCWGGCTHFTHSRSLGPLIRGWGWGWAWRWVIITSRTREISTSDVVANGQISELGQWLDWGGAGNGTRGSEATIRTAVKTTLDNKLDRPYSGWQA